MKPAPNIIGLLWVAAQFLLLGGWGYFLLSDRNRMVATVLGLHPLFFAGLLPVICGLLLMLCGTFGLGSNLRPTPEPKETGHLITTGIYARIRHPIYGGILLMVWGGTLLTLSGTDRIAIIAGAILITFFFVAKSRYEERRLVARFPEYVGYRLKTGRFFPNL